MTLDIKFDADLQPHNSLAIPARTKVLARASSLQDVIDAVSYADKNELSLVVLGDGTNTVFEHDYDGLVLLVRMRGIDVIAENTEYVKVRVAAGENWHDWVKLSVTRGWFGLENLALIPGLVGAAPIQNIGAYGVEVCDFLVEVEYLDIETSDWQVIDNEECAFAYRDSIFKHALAGKTIITAVVFRLRKQAASVLSYPALASRLGSVASPRQVFDMVCKIRSEKLPLPEQVPNVGSFFKNPVVGEAQHTQLKARFPELVSFPAGPRFKLAAAWMIEHAGWKDKQLNNVGVHQHQALVLINPAHQKGKAVVRFARAVQRDILDRFGIELEIEPTIY